MPKYKFEYSYSSRGEGVVNAPDEATARDYVAENYVDFEKRGDFDVEFVK